MWNVGFIILTVLVSLCLSAFSEEKTTSPRGFMDISGTVVLQ